MEANEKIFVAVLSGTIALVPVGAKRIEGNRFEIIENESLDLKNQFDVWEFFPGDVVWCEEISRENKENVLLATRLVSSTFPDRALHQLIYSIVSHMGDITREELGILAPEIPKLRGYVNETNCHPLLRKWMMDNVSA